MKFYKKSELYGASNVTFNPQTKEAFSYGWWGFVKVISGKVIFNNYNYSNTTCKHQSKVRTLMRELGVKIDREVQCKGGIHNIDSLKELNSTENATLKMISIREEAKRVERNQRAKEKRAAKKAALTAEVQS